MYIMKKILLFLMIFSVLLCSCAENRENSKSITAMDTVMTITAYENSSEAIDVFEKVILKLDHMWDVNQADSEISRFNATYDLSLLSPETSTLLVSAMDYSKKTSGCLDLTLLPLSNLWGFSSGSPSRPSEEEIAIALKQCGANRIRLNENGIEVERDTKIDLGSVAKGFAADLIADHLKSIKCNSAVLSLGGNIRTVGTKPDGSDWVIALQDPKVPNQILGTFKISGDMSIVTSGSYQRFFEEDGKHYCHIFDPKTGSPVDGDLVSVTVLCESGLQADAYSTALFVMGREEAIKFYQSNRDFELVFITEQGDVFVSAGLEDAFQLENSSGNYQISYFN